MTDNFFAAMRLATLSTRAANAAEATRLIQEALAGYGGTGRQGAASAPEMVTPPARRGATPFPVDPDADLVEPADAPAKASAGAETPFKAHRMRQPLGETLKILREGRRATCAVSSLPGMGLTGLAGGVAPAIPEGAQFQGRSFTCAAGTRRYRLYIPASAHRRPRGLVVMLHGCKQNPDDFASGTGMNAVGEANGLLVAYPGQTGADNASSCWNWFRPVDQRRDSGEPSIIAGITREIMSEFGIEPDRVFIAGLSAGGAMAAVMGEAYPDIYAGVGIHSGLASGSANDVMSAFSAMRGDAGPAIRPSTRAAAGPSGPVRTIVFHGTADRTVHPSNAERIVAAVAPDRADVTVRQESGRSAYGRTYTRTVVSNQAGSPLVERWMLDGAGHAWSGGQAGGSYTEPNGPDASSEMVRFFLSGQR